MSQHRALNLIQALRYSLSRNMSIAHAVNGVCEEGIDSKLQRIAAELVDDSKPKVVQDQRSTHDQLVDLVDIANKNGKYDAADWLKRELERPGAGWEKCAERFRERV